MITLDNISYEIAGRFLFKDSTLQITPGDRMALVGRNGTGKTTLLRIIAGEDSPTGGQLSMSKGLKVGYLPQEHLSYQTEKSIFGVAMEAFEAELTLKAEMEELIKQIDVSQDQSLIDQLSSKQMEFEAREGYQIESKAHAILDGLGFPAESHKEPFTSLSGGWRMRVMLSRLLLQQPDLMLLDEPTNHLDLPSIEWLEDYLDSFKGAFIMVSHDRYFLDRLTRTTVEIDRSNFNIYKGNYSFYLTERELRREIQQREFENQQKFISDTERFINRFRAKATKAKQVQSKVKMLDRLERIPAPEADAATVSFSFNPSVTPGKDILRLEIDQKKYGEKQILTKSSQYIGRGDKIALIGANGLGKSTALRIIAGTEPFEGESKLGHNVMPGFFAQHQLEALGMKNSILEEFGDYARKNGETFVRNVLGGFLFSGDDVDKKIMVLSGGEKSRVALAKTLMEEANFLLLDEPTNHLDIQSMNILVDALNKYSGTFIVISHDRYFLSRVANKIWYIEDKELREFPGNFTEYEYHLKNRELPKIPKMNNTPGQPKKVDNGQSGKEKYLADKEKKRNLNRLKGIVSKAEGIIEEMEEKKSVLVDDMQNPENAMNFDKLSELQIKMDEFEAKIMKWTEDWDNATNELEEMGEA